VSRVAGVEGFRPSIRYDGTDTGTLAALAAAGHGLTLLPGSSLPATAGAALREGLVSMPVLEPPVVHRVELIHGTLPAGSPAAELASLLS
jgi:DNA-binding transcriptional LysR family regulator